MKEVFQACVERTACVGRLYLSEEDLGRRHFLPVKRLVDVVSAEDDGAFERHSGEEAFGV